MRPGGMKPMVLWGGGGDSPGQKGPWVPLQVTLAPRTLGAQDASGPTPSSSESPALSSHNSLFSVETELIDRTVSVSAA